MSSQIHLSVLWQKDKCPMGSPLVFYMLFYYSIDSAPQYIVSITVCQIFIPWLSVLIFLPVCPVGLKARTESSLCTCTLTGAWHRITTQ